MQRIYISIIESIYLFYMFRHFKTSVDFNMSRKSCISHKIFDHLVTNQKGLRICPFGRVAILALIAILLLRHFISIPPKYIRAAFIIGAVLSLLNLNAVVYLLPVFAVEFFNVTHKP